MDKSLSIKILFRLYKKFTIVNEDITPLTTMAIPKNMSPLIIALPIFTYKK